VRLFGRAWRIQVDDLVISELDCTFKVQRTLRPNPNACELTVYKLTREHRAQISTRKKQYVQIEAGYTEGTSRIFAGDVRKAESENDGKDWVTKIHAGDGERAYTTARVSRSFGPDTSVESVVRAVAESLGVGLGNSLEALAGASLSNVGQAFPAGVVIDGKASREMTALMNSCGLEWSVQEGVLQILPKSTATTVPALVLSPSTGLIGTPAVGKGKIVKARTLIQPGLTPGHRVQLRDTEGPTGLFRIETTEYSGQTDGKDWYADLALKTLG
jgi:hypothetical protein